MTTADWSVLELDYVLEVAESAAAKVANQYKGVVAFDDAYQDALIVLASSPEAVRAYVRREKPGLLHHWLWCDLMDIAKATARRTRLDVPLIVEEP